MIRTILLLIAFSQIGLLQAQQKTSKPIKIKDLKNFSFIPMGKCKIGSTTSDVHAFYISKYEVSNEEYREFLNYLKQHNETEKLAVAQIDTLKWRTKDAFNEPLVKYYHTHPAYNIYPVVNVSYEAAVLYCQWLTQTYNQKHSTENYTVEFRLPTQAEWVRAARGNSSFLDYTWGGPYMQNAKGVFLCNFRRLSDKSIHYNPETKNYEVISTPTYYDAADITAPVSSYYPNELGLYNMCGNVAEMISEKGIALGGSWKDTGYDVRIESTANYTEPSPTVGFRPMMTFIAK